MSLHRIPVTNKTIASDVRTTLPQLLPPLVQAVIKTQQLQFFIFGPVETSAGEGQNAQGRESRYCEKFYRQQRGFAQSWTREFNKNRKSKLRKLNAVLISIFSRLRSFRCEIR